MSDSVALPDDMKDSYHECLKYILSFYDVQSDIKGIISSLPREPGVLLEEDLFLIAEKLSLKIDKVKISFSNVPKIVKPAILLFDDGPCLFIPGAGSNDGKFVFPGKEVEEKEFDLKSLKDQYTGYAIFIFPAEQDASIDVSHMKQKTVSTWFWKPITAFWGQYAEIILCTCFINLLALAVPLFTLNVYDRVVINFAEDTLIVLTTGVLLALIFDFFFKVMRSYILEKISNKISPQYDYDLMERLVHIKEADIALTVGEKSNMFRELQGIKEFYASKLIPTIVDVPFFLLFVFIIYLIAPPLAVVPIIAASIILTVNFLAQIPINKMAERTFKYMQNKSTVLVEMLNGIHTIRILNATGNKLLKWKIVSESSAEVSFGTNMITSAINNLSATISQMAYIFTVFLGAYLIRDDVLTVGGLIACTIIYSRSMAPVVSFTGVVSKLKKSKDILETINKVFELPHDDMQSNISGIKGPFKGHIEIKDLSYQYPGQARPALYKNNIEIKAGERVGIIGKTGAGKTTLSKVIAGVIKPSEGGIFMDGYTYSSISDTELYRSIGYIPQDSFYFSGTIAENIFMGQESDFSQEYIKKVIEMSGLNLVMEQTGEGLDMDIGESGKKLSGGQRQAISIARAIIRNPDLLIFDEPTTGMDSALEARVQQSLNQLIQGKTFIMVTHRTSLLSLVERLIVIDKGVVVADGPRDDVMRALSGKAAS